MYDLLDLSMALSLMALFFLTAWTTARRTQVSLLPSAVILPVLFVLGMVFHLPGSPFYLPSDGAYYVAWGESISFSWSGAGERFDRQIWPGKGVWPTVIAVMHFLFGPVPITLIAINVCAFGLTVLALQKTVALLIGQSPKWSMVLVMLTSTPFLLFGPSLLRESIFWLGAAGVVLAIAFMSRGRARWSLLSLSWASFALLAMRPDAGMAIVWSAAAVLAVLWILTGGRRSGIKVALAAGALAALAASAFPALGYLNPKIDVSFVDTTVAGLSKSGIDTAFRPTVSDSVIPSSVGSDSSFCDLHVGVKVMCSGAANLMSALLGPFPWEYGAGLIWPVAGLATTHFLGLAGFSLYYLVRSRGQRSSAIAIAIVATITLLIFASILTNYGALIRFRAATEILLIPLAIAGFHEAFRQFRSRPGRRHVESRES